MTDENEHNQEDQKKKKDEQVWPLPYCTTAPSAEHTRATDEDEPCDDARGKEIEEKKDKS
jgi:hypothetical protein